MTTTTTSYLGVQRNLTLLLAATAKEPAAKNATAYFSANIGKISSISDFVGNYRLLSYALQAYGLGDQVNNTALVRKVLEGGVSSSSSLANTLGNSAWRVFAAAFDFTGKGVAAVTNAGAVQTTESNYVRNQLESDQGQQDVGVQLALYFERVAPSITSAYGILADKNLLEVAQTIFGLPPETASASIDTQAVEITTLMPMASLQDPARLERLTERFTASYDLAYGPGSTSSSTPLTAAGSATSTTTSSAAYSILAGVISSNSDALGGLSSTSTLFSSQLLTSIQGLTLGG